MIFKDQEYQRFADYPSDSLPNHDIKPKVDNPAELVSALQNNQEQLLLATPICMKYKQ